MFYAVAVVYSFSAAARTTAVASGRRKSTLIELQKQTISEILQQTASIITEKRVQIKNLANFPKMNAIQADEKGFSFLNSPTVFEIVGPTHGLYCACPPADIVPLTHSETK